MAAGCHTQRAWPQQQHGRERHDDGQPRVAEDLRIARHDRDTGAQRDDRKAATQTGHGRRAPMVSQISAPTMTPAV